MLLLSATLCFSQTGSVNGVVTDSLTGQPVANLTVFIPSTTSGTTTNQKGEYRLDKLNPGVYTLMFRHLSYPSTTRQITMEPGKEIVLNLVIAEQSRKMAEVVIVGKIPDRGMAYYLFKQYFLGDVSEVYCKLENPEVLTFYYDRNILKASAREPLKITNRHLGYRVTFFLDYFQCIDNPDPELGSHENSYFGYSGFALFEDLTAAMPLRALSWKLNRSGEFKGSFRNFLACLHCNELINNHYHVRRAYHGFNEIQLVEKRSNAMSKIRMAGMDSLAGWNHITGKPDILYYDTDVDYAFDGVLKDSPGNGRKSLETDALLLVFRDFRKSEDLTDDFISTLSIPKAGITLDKDGNFWSVHGEPKWVNLDNALQIKRLLPFDYITKINEAKK